MDLSFKTNETAKQYAFPSLKTMQDTVLTQNVQGIFLNGLHNHTR